MGGACNPHGGISDTKTPDVLRAPARQEKPRPPKAAIQRHRVEANLQWCHIKPKELEERAKDKAKWRALTHKAAANYEEARYQKLTAAREKRHRAASAVTTTTDFQCPHCSRLCASRLGLQSHLRVHR